MFAHRSPAARIGRLLPACLRVLMLFGLLLAVALVLAGAPGALPR